MQLFFLKTVDMILERKKLEWKEIKQTHPQDTREKGEEKKG